jgi:hypothetical protein
MMDTLNDPAHGLTKGPHCTGKIDGFPVEYPRQEGVLAGTNPFGTDGNSFSPVALVNRFDLAIFEGIPHWFCKLNR